MDDTTQQDVVEAPPASTGPPQSSQGLVSRFVEYFRYAPTLPASEITYAERKRSMRKVIAGWVFGTVFIEGIGGTPAVGLFRLLGATPAWIGLFVALPAIATIAQPISSYIIARTGSRKRFFLGISYPGRLMWILIVALGLALPHGSNVTLIIMFFLVFLTRLSLALSHPAWFSWASELPPKNELGEFWGNRQMWGRVSSMISLLALNYYLGTDPPYIRFAVFFVALCGFGWMDIFIHRGVVGVRMEDREEIVPKFREMVLGPMRDPKFRPLLIFTLFFGFSCQLGGGMLPLMFLEEYHLSYFEISLYIPGLIGIVWIIGSRFWGRLVDNVREGDRLVFYVCSFAVATHILIFPMAGSRQHVIIAMPIILGGLSWSGYAIAMTALIIGLSPKNERPRYVATHMLFFGVGNMLGSLGAGQLAEMLVGFDMVLGPFKLTQFRSLYFFSALLRLACLVLLPTIRHHESLPIGVYVRHVFSLNPFERGTWVYVKRKFHPPVRVDDETTATEDAK
jgi:MFS family permease